MGKTKDSLEVKRRKKKSGKKKNVKNVMLSKTV